MMSFMVKRIIEEALLVLCLIRHMAAPVGSPALCYCPWPFTNTVPIPPSAPSDHSSSMHQPCTGHAPAMHPCVTDWLLCT